MDNFIKSSFYILTLWFCLVFYQSITRLVFFLYFLPDDYFSSVSLLEPFKVFILGIRGDISVSSMIVIFPFLISFSLFLRMPQYIWEKTFFCWQGIAWLIVISINILKHFYFYYYQDLFNIFFWEFWISLENSILVIWSIQEELPIWHIATFGIGSIFMIKIIYLLIYTLLPTFSNFSWTRSPWITLIGLLLLLVGIRGTFDYLPLSMQTFRGRIGTQPHSYFTHSNPFYALYNSWDQSFTTALKTKDRLTSEFKAEKVASWFQVVEQINPGSQAEILGKQSKLHYKIPALRPEYLNRKPKHVVLLFMESYFTWPSELMEQDFAEKVASNMRHFRQKGIYFDRYFQAGAGTIENITKATLGIPTLRSAPYDVTFSDAYKPFSGSMGRMMKAHGYESRFFYGGSLSWHNLSEFINKSGFNKIYSEADFEGAKKTRFGLDDEDLFELLHQKILSSKGDSFSYVMTLSNHPPYQIPDSFVSPVREVPPSISAYVRDKDIFLKRYRAYAYADQALGNFFRKAEKSSYFKDTLFVITADHTVHAPMEWPDKDLYRISRIPLIFYGPDLIRYPGKIISNRGTHYDLMPTLISIISDSSYMIPHWGISLLNREPREELFSFYFDCLRDYCQRNGKSFILQNNLNLKPCLGQECNGGIEEILRKRASFDFSGMYYMFNHNPY